jgi:hypothetical protein
MKYYFNIKTELKVYLMQLVIVARLAWITATKRRWNVPETNIGAFWFTEDKTEIFHTRDLTCEIFSTVKYGVNVSFKTFSTLY